MPPHPPSPKKKKKEVKTPTQEDAPVDAERMGLLLFLKVYPFSCSACTLISLKVILQAVPSKVGPPTLLAVTVKGYEGGHILDWDDQTLPSGVSSDVAFQRWRGDGSWGN